MLDGDVDKDLDMILGCSDTDGRSLGKHGFLGFANWSNRVKDNVLPGDLLNGRLDNADDSRFGIVGIKSVLRRPMKPLAHPAGITPSSATKYKQQLRNKKKWCMYFLVFSKLLNTFF